MLYWSQWSRCTSAIKCLTSSQGPHWRAKWCTWPPKWTPIYAAFWLQSQPLLASLPQLTFPLCYQPCLLEDSQLVKHHPQMYFEHVGWRLSQVFIFLEYSYYHMLLCLVKITTQLNDLSSYKRIFKSFVSPYGSIMSVVFVVCKTNDKCTCHSVASDKYCPLLRDLCNTRQLFFL